MSIDSRETEVAGLIRFFDQKFEDLYNQAREDAEAFIEEKGGSQTNYLNHFINGILINLNQQTPFFKLSRSKNVTPEMVEATAAEAQQKYDDAKKILDTYCELIVDFPQFRDSQIANQSEQNMIFEDLQTAGSKFAEKRDWVVAVAKRLRANT